MKKIRNLDYTDPKALYFFVDKFVDKIYVNKDKKIAVLIKLSDGIYNSECSDNSTLVDQQSMHVYQKILLSATGIYLNLLFNLS